jgi:cell division protein FtsQ
MISLWVVFVAGLIVVMSFASRSHANRLCGKLNISIERSNSDLFIKEEDVSKLLTDHGKYPVGQEMSQIDISSLENLVLSHPAVESCEVFISVGGDMNINIKQRNAAARLINFGNESFYFDSRGMLMPWSEEFTAPVILVNGYFTENYGSFYHTEFDSYSSDSAFHTPNLLDDVWQITKRIDADTFLRAQIVQVYITPEKVFELIPRVGDHKIVLGDISDLDEKFKKLLIFYRDGLNRTGCWNDYSIIDLQYKNQIVCTKKIKENGI